MFCVLLYWPPWKGQNLTLQKLIREVPMVEGKEDERHLNFFYYVFRGRYNASKWIHSVFLRWGGLYLLLQARAQKYTTPDYCWLVRDAPKICLAGVYQGMCKPRGGLRAFLRFCLLSDLMAIREGDLNISVRAVCPCSKSALPLLFRAATQVAFTYIVVYVKFHRLKNKIKKLQTWKMSAKKIVWFTQKIRSKQMSESIQKNELIQGKSRPAITNWTNNNLFRLSTTTMPISIATTCFFQFIINI